MGSVRNYINQGPETSVHVRWNAVWGQAAGVWGGGGRRTSGNSSTGVIRNGQVRIRNGPNKW